MKQIQLTLSDFHNLYAREFSPCPLNLLPKSFMIISIDNITTLYTRA